MAASGVVLQPIRLRAPAVHREANPVRDMTQAVVEQMREIAEKLEDSATWVEISLLDSDLAVAMEEAARRLRVISQSIVDRESGE